MFDTLRELTDDQIQQAVTALETDGLFAALLDPSGVYMLFKACPGCEVDFMVAIYSEGRWLPAPLTPMQGAVLHAWTDRTVRRLCTAWKTRSGIHVEDTSIPDVDNS